MSTLLLHDETMLRHENGPGHPERPERLRAVHEALAGARFGHVRWGAPAAASEDQLRRVHAPRHVDRILALRGRTARLDPDTACNPHSVECALLAAGAAVQAVDAVCTGEADSAFALVRPPGHHAEPERAMGFCLFNNVAVAAARAVDVHGAKRVLIVDWDVHHGNGTQAAFFDRDDVLLFSTHQWPHYPGTGRHDEIGAGPGRGFTVNVPLPPGLGDEAYGEVFDRLLAPVAGAWGPDLVLVSAGFDAHRDDALGGMNVTDTGFADLLGRVRAIARRHAGGRLALVLEGGYDLRALANSVRGCVARLNEPDEPEPPAPPPRQLDLTPYVEALAPYWPCLST